ncbi:unnamed protein product [Phytomonas sp. Hart1]|nr:unnamed protein product [Phytomonas sp. Hart1]|eukprot:CCW71904.1 unnamed protein product [Phytomonas sp. isolate Hart1]
MVNATIIVKESAMSWDLQQDCVDCVAHAFYNLRIREQNQIAKFVKCELDSKYGESWYCIVGHSFGALVGHDGEYYVYLQVENVYVLIWRMDMECESKLVPLRLQATRSGDEIKAQGY